MLDLLTLLSERARGLILTFIGTGVGVGPEVVSNKFLQLGVTQTSLLPLQKVVLVLTGIVALLTIISYLYKFVMWAKKILKKVDKPSE